MWSMLALNSVNKYAQFIRAVGNKMYGLKYGDQISETLRKTVEHCDCLQSFFLLHSMGGGEGQQHVMTRFALGTHMPTEFHNESENLVRCDRLIYLVL